jgi:hypothetical protein
MKRASVSPQGRTKSKSLTKVASGGLVEYLQDKYPKRIPITTITAATKMFGKGKPLLKDDKIVKRLAGNASDIPTSSLIDLLSSSEHHEKGKTLSDESVKRVYQGFANAEGKLTFEYIMKMGENNGITVNQKMAKMIVKKYGKKDFLNAEDCVRINKRRQSKSQSKSAQKDRR